jgi:hypothetical protein
MEREELCRKYRELDRDLALFYYAVGRYSEENRRIRERFIPNEGNMRAARETWLKLRHRVAELPVPDAVFALVNHIQMDFVDSLEYIINDAWRHPEKAYLGLDSILQNPLQRLKFCSETLQTLPFLSGELARGGIGRTLQIGRIEELKQMAEEVAVPAGREALYEPVQKDVEKACLTAMEAARKISDQEDGKEES